MTKQPDRFARMVSTCQLYGNGSCTPELIAVNDAVKLLRKEHRDVVRMVQHGVSLYIDLTGNHPGHYVALLDLFDRLKKRAT